MQTNDKNTSMMINCSLNHLLLHCFIFVNLFPDESSMRTHKQSQLLILLFQSSRLHIERDMLFFVIEYVYNCKLVRGML